MRRAWAWCEAIPRVAEIVADVRERGDAALREWSERLGDGDARAGGASRRARRARRCVPCGRWSTRSRPCTRRSALRTRPSRRFRASRSTRRWLPLDSVGIYVPAGLVSSLVMTAVPARLAGVERIAVATPRPSHGDARDRARARDRRAVLDGRRAGDRRARLRHRDDRPGRQDRRPRQPLGDRGEAARLGAGRDRPARRAERGARDRRRDAPTRTTCAADLLAQAEHGPDGESILRDHERRARGRRRRARRRPRAGRAGRRRWTRRSRRANELAPEHLELLVDDPERLAAGVRNAGAVFLGTTAVLGDYAAGSNHVLPTGGLARGVGGLGLEAFLKPVQFVRATRRGARGRPPDRSRPSPRSKACPCTPSPWRSGRDT